MSENGEDLILTDPDDEGALPIDGVLRDADTLPLEQDALGMSDEADDGANEDLAPAHGRRDPSLSSATPERPEDEDEESEPSPVPDRAVPAGASQEVDLAAVQQKFGTGKDRIRGVFSTQSVEKVGTGTTIRRTIQKTFWMCEEQDDGHVEIQPLNVNYVPSGPKRKLAKDDLLRQFSPEPEFYVHTVYPAMQKLHQAVTKGEEHRKKGRNFSAEFEFNNAITIDEDNVRANFGLGLTYLQRGESNKADNIFERLVKLDAAFEKKHKHLFNEFGIDLRKNKMYDQAVTYYERAMELSQADEHLHYNMARAYFEKRMLDKTLEHLRTALRMNPDLEPAKLFLEWMRERGAVNADGELRPDVDIDALLQRGPGRAPAGDPADYKMDI